jgi:hypothetical protein
LVTYPFGPGNRCQGHLVFSRAPITTMIGGSQIEPARHVIGYPLSTTFTPSGQPVPRGQRGRGRSCPARWAKRTRTCPGSSVNDAECSSAAPSSDGLRLSPSVPSLSRGSQAPPEAAREEQLVLASCRHRQIDRRAAYLKIAQDITKGGNRPTTLIKLVHPVQRSEQTAASGSCSLRLDQ